MARAARDTNLRVLIIDPHFVALPSPHTYPRVRLCQGPDLPPYPPPPVLLGHISRRRRRGDGVIMSNLTLSIPEGIMQSQADVLGPGIAGLFLQGLLTGLVLAQFCRWYSSPERNDSVAFSVLVVFVTLVGL